MMFVINTGLAALTQQWRDSIDGLKLILTQSSTTLTLHLIYIPLASRGRGYGGKIIQELATYCDRQNLHLRLTPVDEYGIPIDKLRDFYASYGFHLNSDGSMSRQPLFSAEYENQCELSPLPKIYV